MAVKLNNLYFRQFRKILYFFHGRPSQGLLANGEPCKVEDPTTNNTHGDVVHPCVRFIEEGFEGHQWWMVYTPYYSGNESLENPRLCYADTVDGIPPTEWKFYCFIKDTPKTGYNSDPTIIYKDGKLFIFWRECDTPASMELGCRFVTFGCTVHNRIVTPLKEGLLVENKNDEYKFSDREVCPTFLKLNDRFVAYTMHLIFTPKFIFRIPSRVGSYIYRHNIFFLLDALGIYKHIKSRGVALCNGVSLESHFNYIKTVPFKGGCRLYQPWHMDLFSENMGEKEILYAIVQTSVKFADICLARSYDGEQFSFYKKPLLTSITKGLEGIYKPTALIVGDRFVVYYTARDSIDSKLNRLYVTSVNWSLLKRMLET